MRELSRDVPRVGLYSAVRSLTMTPAPNRTAYAAWLAVCVLWGTMHLAICDRPRNAAAALHGRLPLHHRRRAAGGRAEGAAARRCRRPAAWGRLAVLGILLLGFGNGGLVWAEQTIPSGFAALLRGDDPVLDGRHRLADAGSRAPHASADRRARRRVRGCADAGVAGDRGRRRPWILARRDRGRDRVRRLGAGVELRAAPEAGGERARRGRASR